MAVATYTDVAVALGRPISDTAEQAQVEWWLDGVELFITARLGDVTALDQTVLKYVEVEAVVAKIQRAGRGESSITVSVDDGSVTRRYENAVTAGDISDQWWNLLDPNANADLASVRPGFEADSARWPVSTPPYFGDTFNPTDPGWTRFP
jgi:hypothetical protein